MEKGLWKRDDLHCSGGYRGGAMAPLQALECTKHKQDDQAMHLNAIWTTVLLTAGDGKKHKMFTHKMQD